MSEFLKKASILILILLGLNFYVFNLTQEEYRAPYEVLPDASFEAYLMADSRGLPLDTFLENYGIYNFSYGSDSYYDVLNKVKYLKKNSNVKTVFLSVDDHQLSCYRDTKNNLYRSQYFLPQENYNNYFKYLYEKYFNYYIVILNPEIRDLVKIILKKNLTNVFSKKNTKILELKKGTHMDTKINPSESWASLDLKTKKQMCLNRIYTQYPCKERSEDLVKTMMEIIDYCQTSNIELIGLKFPLPQLYIDLSKDLGFHADSVLRANQIRVLDHTVLYANNDSMFQNQDHLNNRGGRKYARLLGKIKANSNNQDN